MGITTDLLLQLFAGIMVFAMGMGWIPKSQDHQKNKEWKEKYGVVVSIGGAILIAQALLRHFF